MAKKNAMTFKVTSKTRKENEKEEGLTVGYHYFMQGIENSSLRINLHSDKKLEVNIGNEFALMPTVVQTSHKTGKKEK